MEPNTGLMNWLAGLLPFAAYFFGIVIRKYAWRDPKTKTRPLARQFLIGVPVALVVATPFITLLRTADLPSFLITLGLLMEHGMVAHETLAQQLEKLIPHAG